MKNLNRKYYLLAKTETNSDMYNFLKRSKINFSSKIDFSGTNFTFEKPEQITTDFLLSIMAYFSIEVTYTHRSDCTIVQFFVHSTFYS